MTTSTYDRFGDPISIESSMRALLPWVDNGSDYIYVDGILQIDNSDGKAL
jgi:hypothetical protein